MRQKFTFILSAVVLMLFVVNPSVAAQGGGNSDAAHLCQQGGYTGLVGSNGETFENTGQCVRYAARGGTFAENEPDDSGLTGIVLPGGQIVTFASPTFSSCNALSYGYVIDGVATQLGQKANVCSTTILADQTAGPFGTDVALLVYLTDETCGATYYSDGNHARVSSSNLVDIADAGPGCSIMNSPWFGTGPGNLSVQLVFG